jgi:hypothetical protein
MRRAHPSCFRPLLDIQDYSNLRHFSLYLLTFLLFTIIGGRGAGNSKFPEPICVWVDSPPRFSRTSNLEEKTGRQLRSVPLTTDNYLPEIEIRLPKCQLLNEPSRKGTDQGAHHTSAVPNQLRGEKIGRPTFRLETPSKARRYQASCTMRARFGRFLVYEQE